MGIFHHSPKPELQVTLEGAGLFYGPGAQLHGTVRLINCPPHEHRTDLSLFLWGLAKSKFTIHHNNRTDYYRSRVALLNVRQPVSVPTLQSDGSTMWAFTVTIPPKCILEARPPVQDHHDDYFEDGWKAKDPFDVSPDQDLPPTCDDGESYIHYNVQAQLHTTHDKHDFIYAEQPVLITQGPDASHPQPFQVSDRFLVRSPLLDPSHAHDHGAKLSLMEKASVKMGSSKLPHFTFAYQATVPTQFAIGSPARLDLQLWPVPGPGEAPEPAQVEVESVEVRLTAYINARAQDGSRDKKFTSSHKAFSQELQAGSVAPLSRQTGWAASVMTIPIDGIGPDLSTYNITRGYDLEVEWVLRCAGDKHKITALAADVNPYTNMGVPPPTQQMPVREMQNMALGPPGPPPLAAADAEQSHAKKSKKSAGAKKVFGLLKKGAKSAKGKKKGHKEKNEEGAEEEGEEGEEESESSSSSSESESDSDSDDSGGDDGGDF